MPTTEEQIEDLKKVTLADVRKFYAEFYGASHGELVAVGQFDQPALQKTAAELLGSWTNPAPYARMTPSKSHARQPEGGNARQAERQIRSRHAH